MRNVFLLTIAICSIYLISSRELAGQSYQVVVDDALFVRDGAVIGKAASGTEIYALKKKGNRVLAVEPTSQTQAWIGLENLRLNRRTRRQRRAIDGLVDRMDTIEAYVNASSATLDELEETIAWASQLRELEGDTHPTSAIAMEYAGLVAMGNGAYERSREYLRQALNIRLAVYGKESSKTAEIYYDLADLYLETGELAEAARTAKKVWQINSKELGGDHPDAVRALLPLGQALEMIDDHEGALEKYLTVYETYEQQYGMDDPRCLQIAAMVAPVLINLDRRQQAVDVFEQTIHIIQDKHPELDQMLTICQTQLAAAQLSAEVPESIEHMQQALGRLQAKYPEVYAYMRSEHLQLIQALLERNDLETAFRLADVLNRRLRDSIRQEFWGMSAQQQQDYLAFADGYSFYQSISLAVDYLDHELPVQLGAEWLINGKGLVQEAQAVQAGAVQDLQRRQSWANQEWVNWDSLQAELADDEVYVDILKYLDFDLGSGQPVENEYRYAAWLLSSQSSPRLIELGSADRLDAAIAELQQVFFAAAGDISTAGERTALTSLQPKLKTVSQLLWKPILRECGEARSIIISPDQATWLVPWAALLTDDQTFAVESHRIQLALSGRELLRNDEKLTSGQAVIFADPSFDVVTQELSSEATLVQRGVQFDFPLRLPRVPQLAWSALEAKAIRPSLEALTGIAPQLMLEQEALESRFKDLHGPSVLVLSTHGFFSSPTPNQPADEGRGLATAEADWEGDPLFRCGLLLAGANQHRSVDRLGNDGVLTGAEIASTDLQGTRLAVLSACETGLGKLEATGGVVGLRRAFHIAGARAVVSTLWQIPDQETALIMNDLFRYLSRQPDINAGLQAAQRAAIARLRRTKGVAHPYFWAAFNLTGRAEY